MNHELDFDTEYHAFLDRLGKSATLVLATSADGRTTARSMSCIVLDSQLCFQTDIRSTKAKQIIKNPLVALCVDNLQIEAAARIGTSPMDAENRRFADAYQASFPGSFEAYSSTEGEVVVRAAPLRVTQWVYRPGGPARIVLDIPAQRAWQAGFWDDPHEQGGNAGC